MSDIQELEAQKEDLKVQVELRDQILRLSNNSDFRKVFHQGFFRDEAARNVRIGGDPSLSKAERKDAIAMGLAAGHVQRYLHANVQMGNLAAEQIKQIDEVLQELRTSGEDE